MSSLSISARLQATSQTCSTSQPSSPRKKGQPNNAQTKESPSLFHRTTPHAAMGSKNINALCTDMSTSQNRCALLLRLCEEGIIIANSTAIYAVVFPLIGASAPNISLRNFAYLLLTGSAQALVGCILYRVLEGALSSQIGSSSDQATIGEMTAQRSRIIKAISSLITACSLSLSLELFLAGFVPNRIALTAPAFFVTFGAAAVEGCSLLIRNKEFVTTHDGSKSEGREKQIRDQLALATDWSKGQLRNWLILAADFLCGLFSVQNIIPYVCEPSENHENREDFSKISAVAFIVTALAVISIILRYIGVFYYSR